MNQTQNVALWVFSQDCAEKGEPERKGQAREGKSEGRESGEGGREGEQEEEEVRAVCVEPPA